MFPTIFVAFFFALIIGIIAFAVWVDWQDTHLDKQIEETRARFLEKFLIVRAYLDYHNNEERKGNPTPLSFPAWETSRTTSLSN